MKEADATKYSAKISTKKKNGLGERIIGFITALSENPETTRKLKVKIEDCEEPIDVLTSRFKSRQDVDYHGHHLIPQSIFTALDRVLEQLP